MYYQVFWQNPGRRRDTKAKYDNADYVWFYDLDSADFTELVKKIIAGVTLSYDEDVRYGKYLQTIGEIVLENPRFKRKPQTEKNDLREAMYFDLSCALPKFNPSRAAIFSFAYRIAYLAIVHYYQNIVKDKKKSDAINAHLEEVYADYMEEYSDHKVNTNGKNHEEK